jgi:hypothetical protein
MGFSFYGPSIKVVMRRCKTKKAPASSPAGHDYRQPKVEEGAGAFRQGR